MFKCEKCKKTTKPYEKMTRQVIAKRNKTYVNNVDGQEKITEGYETVKEISLCEKCASEIVKDLV